MSTIPNLHDATLCSIVVDWSAEIVTLMFRTGTEDTGLTTIEAVGITKCEFSKLKPWGNSDDVLAVSIKPNAHGESVNFELQSGDELKIDCGSLSVISSSGDWNPSRSSQIPI